MHGQAHECLHELATVELTDVARDAHAADTHAAATIKAAEAAGAHAAAAATAAASAAAAASSPSAASAAAAVLGRHLDKDEIEMGARHVLRRLLHKSAVVDEARPAVEVDLDVVVARARADGARVLDEGAREERVVLGELLRDVEDLVDNAVAVEVARLVVVVPGESGVGKEPEGIRRHQKESEGAGRRQKASDQIRVPDDETLEALTQRHLPVSIKACEQQLRMVEEAAPVAPRAPWRPDRRVESPWRRQRRRRRPALPLWRGAHVGVQRRHALPRATMRRGSGAAADRADGPLAHGPREREDSAAGRPAEGLIVQLVAVAPQRLDGQAVGAQLLDGLLVPARRESEGITWTTRRCSRHTERSGIGALSMTLRHSECVRGETWRGEGCVEAEARVLGAPA